MVLVDLFITTTSGRERLFSATVGSLKKNTDMSRVRTTLAVDGNNCFTFMISEFDVVHSAKQRGLGPSINSALAHIQTVNSYFEHPTHGDPSQVAPLVCMLQDDVLLTPGWLDRLVREFVRWEGPCRLGFASGHDAPEHPLKKDLGNGLLLKDSIRATCVLGRRDYWMSMFPIPRFDPETGNVRARPNDGIGSSVDWWFLRDAENSVQRTGRTNLVVPGLVLHNGFDRSTWLARELPESEQDRRLIEEHRK